MTKLTVALDAVAALRDAVGARETDLVAATKLAELAGAAGIALGLSDEALAAAEEDVHAVRRAARGFELFLAPVQSCLKLALEVRPERVVLTSLERDERGTGAPLDFRAYGSTLAPFVRTLHEAGLEVSALVQPDLEAVKAAYQSDLRGVDLWAAPVVDLPRRERAQAADRLGDAARLAAKLRLAVSLTGGLGPHNVSDALAMAPVADRVVTGRALASRALLVGVDRAVRDLRGQLP